MSHTEELKRQVLEIIGARKETYGRVLVQSGILKRDGKWHNVVTKVIPLHLKESPNSLRKLDYGEFAIIESLISLEELTSLIKSLSEDNNASFSLDGYQIENPRGNLSNGYEYDSGEEYLNVGWFFKKFYFSAGARYNRIGPLISPKLPLFVDSNDAVLHCLGVDLASSGNFGIIICLPSYYARIKEVKVGPTELLVSVETREMAIDDLMAKCYCRSGDRIRQEDIDFSTSQGRVFVGFRPERAYIALVSKSNNEMLDKREFYSSWRLPKDVIIDIPEFEIRQLIEQGESNTLEFKRQIDSKSRPKDVSEFVESIVAFANAKGGIILLGVDDDTTVQGLSEKDSEERIRNIVRSHCIPEPKYECTKRSLDEKEILLIKVEEGSDKPYTVRQKGVFIRAGGSDRIAERYELDEIYKPKTSTTNRWAYP
jgi:hypothetical protein